MRRLIVAGVIVASGVLGVANASALIYWSSGTLPGTVQVATLDGTQQGPLWNQRGVIAVDGGHVYETNAAGAVNAQSYLQRFDLAGDPNSVQQIAGPDVSGVAVSATKLYTVGAGNVIVQMDLDGSNQVQFITTGAVGISGLAVDGTYVYWSSGQSPGEIERVPIASPNTPPDVFVSNISFPGALATDAHYLYWVSAGGMTIGRVPIDDINTQPAQPSFIPTAPSSAGGIAVDAQYVYWTDFQGDTVGRANLDGTNPDQSFITTGAAPDSIAVDGLTTLPAVAAASTTMTAPPAPPAPPLPPGAAVPKPRRCVVPHLSGKTLAAARTLLAKAHCALGKVTKPKKATGTLIVASQSPAPDRFLAAGAKVAVRLAVKPKPKPKPKHKKHKKHEKPAH
jgi:hypothetical protein